MPIRSATLISLVLLTVPAMADSVCPQTETTHPLPVVELRHPVGLLWRIDPGHVPPSYLFGTIHLEDERVTKLPDPVERIFLSADRLAVEIDLQPQAMAQLSRAMTFSGDETLTELLDSAVYDRLAGIAQSQYGLSREVLDGLKPWAVFTVLSRPRPQTGKVLDQILQERARTLGIPVHGLESALELTEVLDGMPIADQLAILKDTICNYDDISGQIHSLTARYLERDLAGMAALNAQAHDDEGLFDRLMERVLYRRNERILERLQTHLEAGNSFIAVGALHLPGDRGLLNGLERRGYRVSVEY